MKFIGLDLGTKTLGISMSEGIIATTYKTIRYDDEQILIDELMNIINEYKINVVVLGLPKNMNNSLGPRALETITFGDKLKDLGLCVEYQDERLSSKSAHDFMIEGNLSRKKRKQKVDSLAATIILQTYLDRRKNL